VGAGVDGAVEVEAGEEWSSGGGRRQGREGAVAVLSRSLLLLMAVRSRQVVPLSFVGAQT
jgi:hypothetical protein